MTAMRIVVLGYVVRGPIGGMAWSDLHYLLGLRSLGHDVVFLEDSDDYAACFDPSTGITGTDPGYGLRFAARLFDAFGLGEGWAYHDAHAGAWHGPLAQQLDAFAGADLVLDLAGVNPLRPWIENVPVRVLVDKDPGFTQARNRVDDWARSRAAAHTSFFTFAADTDRLPDDGFPWRPTRHPIALEEWPAVEPHGDASWTTVMQWQGYAADDAYGEARGTKGDSFRVILDLPRRVGVPLEIALGGAEAPRAEILAHGWRLRDPYEAAGDAWAYRDYIRGSRGELTVAKLGYVSVRSGWFSERSASYLASGRPVVTQETGFSEWLPTGDGLLAFATADEAAAALAETERRYAHHAAAARELAETWFDARDVLARLLDEAG